MKPKCVTILNKIEGKNSFDYHEFDVNMETLTGVCKNCGLIVIADEEDWNKMKKKLDTTKMV